MALEQFATYREIKSQTRAWEQAIHVWDEVDLPEAAEKYDQTIFTGCGSTYYLSLAAAALYQELTGCAARAVPASELLLNPQSVVPQTGNSHCAELQRSSPDCLLVAISRSGTTTETVKAVEQFKEQHLGEVVVISNYDGMLAQLADIPVVIDEGQEESVAQTRSFASMYLAAMVFCVRMADRTDLLDRIPSLPAIGERLIRDFEPVAREMGENLDFDRFYFAGAEESVMGWLVKPT